MASCFLLVLGPFRLALYRVCAIVVGQKSGWSEEYEVDLTNLIYLTPLTFNLEIKSCSHAAYYIYICFPKLLDLLEFCTSILVDLFHFYMLLFFNYSVYNVFSLY